MSEKISYHLYFRKNNKIVKEPMFSFRDKENYYDITFHLGSNTRPNVGDILKLENLFSAEICYLKHDMEKKETFDYVRTKEKKRLQVLKKYGLNKDSKFKISEIEFYFEVSYSCVNYNVYVDL